MAHPESEHSLPGQLSIEDGSGKEVTTPGAETDQIVIATDAQGNSLTLLEEFAERRKNRVSPVELAISLACATASLAFAALIYFNTH